MPFRFRWIVAGMWLIALSGCNSGPESSTHAATPASQASGIDAFLSKHWQRPLAAQGPAPAGYSQLESALDPSSCGTCHAQQFNDWKTALHSKAMGPGLIGQLQAMGPQATEDHQACLICHAPLHEQADHLQQSLAAVSGKVAPGTRGASFEHGLTCAACHVRSSEHFGPPRKDGSTPKQEEKLPHNGWTPSAAFENSKFCAACHQFEPDGPALNGKLLENTYEEWRASRHERENRSCQSCHMPDRRHLWRGIHDPEMVKSGLEIKPLPLRVVGGQIQTGLEIANRGVGHYFPSYVTPQVIVEITQKDHAGRIIPGTTRQQVVARSVSLDLAEEFFDTRIAPDEVRRFAYDEVLNPRAAQLGFKVTVEPDAFYANFYRATLNDADFHQGRMEIERALQNAQHSIYVLFETSRRMVQ